MTIDENGLPKLRYTRLKPCPKCGGGPKRPQYLAGLGRGIPTSNIFSCGQPVWYIYCEDCGNNMRIRIKRSTFEEQQKCLTKISREWNKQWTADSVVERLVLLVPEERGK